MICLIAFCSTKWLLWNLFVIHYKWLNICLDATLFPEGIEVMNTTYNYLDVRWRDTRPNFFLYGRLQGYLVTLENMDDPSEEETLIFTSCHSEGINITNLKENTTYCVYIAAFTEHGKGNSTSCMMAVTGEKRRFGIWFGLHVVFSFKLWIFTNKEDVLTVKRTSPSPPNYKKIRRTNLRSKKSSLLVITSTLNVSQCAYI